MKIYFVRHGETDANRLLEHGVSGPMHNEPVSFKPGDNINIPLNIHGREQAQKTAGELPDVIDVLYFSPLLRVRETAEIIASAKGIDHSQIQSREELVEYSQGTLEGLSIEQKREKTGGQSWGSGLLCNYDYTPWGGDKWETIYARLHSFIEELQHQGGEKNIVCVTSGGVIRMAYKILLSEKSPTITNHVLIQNGSIHEFVI
jgi:broad specificity phosphatase PhoE